MADLNLSGEKDGVRLVVYPGDNKILLAMSIADDRIDQGRQNLAGFAIWRQLDGQPEEPLLNRISFDIGVSKATTAATRKWTPSDQAPFQKFRWVDVPAAGFEGPIMYRVRALYFTGQGQAMRDGPEISLQVQPAQPRHRKFRPAFTRGYIASQAYTDRFHNADIRPAGPKTPHFDTAPFMARYEWLGADARKRLFEFIADCEADAQAKIDVFAYDLDEPDIIAAVCRLGRQGRLRAILDDAGLHSKPGKDGVPPEIEAARMIIAAAGQANVRQGHFARYQHNKVFIKRDRAGKAERVIFGSMNFSVRGLYVQANNLIAVDDPDIAGMFAHAFDLAFAGGVKAAAIRSDPVSRAYLTGAAADGAELPKFSLALSPHRDAKISLGPVSARVRGAKSSVLFAVMEPTGNGPVLTSLRTIAAQPTVFSYGTVETDKGLAVQSPNGAMGDLTGFSFLSKNVPFPFSKEFSGGAGRHIHDKFIVVDFNAADPTVFAGSSNLAAGGEQENGDSLVMIEDPAIANMYAIEALALFDHFHFRKAMQAAAKARPLTLWYPGQPGQPTPWWRAYYDPSKIQMRDRYLFAGLPLPAGLAATKNVDWSALDQAAEAKNPPARKKPVAKKRVAAKKQPAAKGGSRRRRTAHR
jgi:phosphatidylserine/phosphatidylglycerophosphate/cardiolipin synthase-like enzyme